jgi:hypothetical protein
MIADHYLQLRTDLETALIRLLRLGADLQRSPASLETLHALPISGNRFSLLQSAK